MNKYITWRKFIRMTIDRGHNGLPPVFSILFTTRSGEYRSIERAVRVKLPKKQKQSRMDLIAIKDVDRQQHHVYTLSKYEIEKINNIDFIL